jgi:MSHA pilin protein MshA
MVHLLHPKTQQGFTLIELAVVVLILGILAAVALPKFSDMKEKAMLSAMDGLIGALESASTLAHSKALINGLETSESATITTEGESIELVYGYPAVNPDYDSTADYGITKMVSTPSGWNERHSTLTDTNAWVYWPEAISEDAGTAQCYVRYRESTGINLRPVIDFQTSGCDDY